MPSEQDDRTVAATAATRAVRAPAAFMPRTCFAAKARAKFPTLRPAGGALAAAPELTAFAFVAVALAHAAFISRAGGICHGFLSRNRKIGRFPIDLQGYGPDKRGPFRCFGLLYIKEYPGIEGRLFSGGVPEWLKGADCKSAGLAYVGSNPTPSTSLRSLRELRLGKPIIAGRGAKRA
jgi:hypothetical protein